MFWDTPDPLTALQWGRGKVCGGPVPTALWWAGPCPQGVPETRVSVPIPVLSLALGAPRWRRDSRGL